MNRHELIQRTAKGAHVTQETAESVLDAMLAAIGDALTNGEKIQLNGIATIQTATIRRRGGRCFQTGEALPATYRREIVLTPADKIKELLNQEY